MKTFILFLFIAFPSINYSQQNSKQQSKSGSFLHVIYDDGLNYRIKCAYMTSTDTLAIYITNDSIPVALKDPITDAIMPFATGYEGNHEFIIMVDPYSYSTPYIGQFRRNDISGK